MTNIINITPEPTLENIVGMNHKEKNYTEEELDEALAMNDEFCEALERRQFKSHFVDLLDTNANHVNDNNPQETAA